MTKEQLKRDALTIDINQYVQDDRGCRLLFNKSKFLDDAVEYLKNDNIGSEIIDE
tara:strand:+ start:856 stop:1020 length:165 start_codon:yes stop_codon:yes gene_type:complete